MIDRADTQAYDAFGERLPALGRKFVTAAGARASIAFIAIFWSLALLLVAGRVHYDPHAAPAAIELAAR